MNHPKLMIAAFVWSAMTAAAHSQTEGYPPTRSHSAQPAYYQTETDQAGDAWSQSFDVYGGSADSPLYVRDTNLVPAAFENTVNEEGIEIAAPETIWYDPWAWARPAWEGSIELGINASAGNAESFSLRAGADLTHEKPTHKLHVNMKHARTSSKSRETQNNALASLRYDQFFGESRWSLFTVGTGEYDEFKAFDYRWAVNAGVGYKFVNHKHLKLSGRFGSGVSREVGGPDNRYVPEAVFGMDYEHRWSDRQKFYAKADYFPDWADFASYRVVVDSGWEILLDQASNLSLKIGVVDRYDSTPNGAKPNDLDYSILLLWKL